MAVLVRGQGADGVAAHGGLLLAKARPAPAPEQEPRQGSQQGQASQRANNDSCMQPQFRLCSAGWLWQVLHDRTVYSSSLVGDETG